MALDYAEVRQMAVWLRAFTPSELAGSLGVSLEVGYRAVAALKFHRICEDSGETVTGPDGGPEPVVTYIPLPPGPRNHPTGLPPEVTTPGCYSEAPRRGTPVSMSNGRVRSSVSGQWRPGRAQGSGKRKTVEGP